MSTKLCKYCATEIAGRAVLCPTCKSYQSGWRNALLFAAGLTGFATLIATGVAFTVQQATQSYKRLFWRDHLNVLELVTGPPPSLKIVVSNDGDGPVFASELTVYFQHENYSFPLRKIIATSSIEVIGTFEFNDPNAPGMSKYDWFAGTKTGTPSVEMLAKGRIAPDGSECFLVQLFDSENADLKRMRNHYAQGGSMLVSASAEAILSFVSSHTGAKYSTSIPVAATFLGSSAPNCSGVSNPHEKLSRH